jgi:hypothetical protein
MDTIQDTEGSSLPFLTKVVSFPNEHLSFELIKPVTNFKSCHDGTPSEARVLFTCRKVPTAAGTTHETQKSSSDEEFIMKIKVQ